MHITLRPYPQIRRFVDGLTVTALVTLVALHILPESLHHGGFITYAGLIAGLCGPLFLSQVLRRHQCEIQKPFLLIAILGFFAHNLLDGIALIPSSHDASISHFLALAIVLHRMLVSMALWNTIKTNLGVFFAVFAISGMTISMSLGFYWAEYFVSPESQILHGLQSLACGMLLHVVLHPHHVPEIVKDCRALQVERRLKSFGAISGMILAIFTYLLWPAHSHSETHTNLEGASCDQYQRQ